MLYTWLGAVAYTLQIYFDFSGYSDMAIGLGKCFGFEFLENFNYPYAADSIRDFWRRWHMSLSGFFRDYVYIPLGGNRCSAGRWILNMMVVWLLTGIWHGADWTYILWGVCYGLLLIIERFLSSWTAKIPSPIKHFLTMVIVTLLWTMFRADSLNQAAEYYRNMVGIGAVGFVDRALLFQFRNFALLLTVGILFSLPVMPWLHKKFLVGKAAAALNVVEGMGLLACTIASVSYIYMGSYNPFLYFMF